MTRASRRGLLAAIALAASLLLACTSEDGEPTAVATAAHSPTSTATAAFTATPRPISTAPPAPGPWQAGEPIALTLDPYPDATLTVVTPDTVLPPRDELDRHGGAFLWERATDRLLFIEGIRTLTLAPQLLDERPLAIASTNWDSTDPRSLIVRLDPFEVTVLPIGLNVSGTFDSRWVSPTTVRVSTWQLQAYDGRTLPEGQYILDLEIATLTLVSERSSGTSSVAVIEEAWPAGRSNVVSMIVQNGRRFLARGSGGPGSEIAGPVDFWVLSPDGSRILMIAKHSLTIFDFAQERLHILGGPAQYGSVTWWSPDGRYIAATVVDSFDYTRRAFVFDAQYLEAVESPDLGATPSDGLPLPPLDGYWTWLWRGPSELFVGSESTLSLLDVETGALTPVLTDRRPYDTLVWDATTSTLARSRLDGVPASILDLDEGSTWFDIPLLAASPHVGLFDMNWGAEGTWLALNTAPGRS